MDRVVTEYWAKPIPDRRFDWLAFYEGDEPNDNGSMAHGEGRTEAEAVLDLIDNHYRGVECELNRRFDECANSAPRGRVCQDGSEDTWLACELHGGCVRDDATCDYHEFDGERFMQRTMPVFEKAESEVVF